MTPTSQLLTTGKAAERIGVSIGTLRRWAQAGQVRHVVMPSGRMRFHPDDLDALLRPVEKVSDVA